MKKALLRYKHAFWLLYVPVYLTVFSLVEKYVTTGYWVSYTPLDDKIPFVEQFVIAYIIWFPAIWGTGLYLLIRDPYPFRRYVWSLIIGYSFSLAVYFIFPNGQDLRPAAFEHTNIFTDAVQSFYSSDTNTNVLPSMHVIGTSAVVFAVFDSSRLRKPWLCVMVVIIGIMIDLSTVFIKQHSILDVWAGLAVSAAIYIIVYVIIKKKQLDKQKALSYSLT